MPFDKDGNWTPPGGEWLTRDSNTATADQPPASPSPAPQQQQGSNFWGGVGNFIGGAENFVKGLFNSPPAPQDQPPLNNAGSVADSVTNGQSPYGTLPTVQASIPQGAGQPAIEPYNPSFWQSVQNEAQQLPGQMQDFGNRMGGQILNSLGIGQAMNAVLNKNIDPNSYTAQATNDLFNPNSQMNQSQNLSPGVQKAADIAGQTIGTVLPFIAGGPIGEAGSAATQFGLSRLIPRLYGTAAGNAIAGAAGQALTGGAVTAAEQALQAATNPSDFQKNGGVGGALGQVAQNAGNFALMGAISPTLGQYGKDMVSRFLPGSIQTGGLSGALRNALVQASGGAITGATLGGVDTLIQYLHDPQKFNADQAGQSALTNALQFGALDALFGMMHKAPDFTMGDSGEQPPTPPPTDYKTYYPNNDSIDSNPYVFKAGTQDMTTKGYNEVLPGMWVNPANSGDRVTELVPHPNDPNWLVPKTLVWRNERAQGKGVGANTPAIDMSDPMVQVRQQVAEQPIFGLPGEAPAQVPPAETAAMGAVAEQNLAPAENPAAIQEQQNVMPPNAAVEESPVNAGVPAATNTPENPNMQPQVAQAGNGVQAPAAPARPEVTGQQVPEAVPNQANTVQNPVTTGQQAAAPIESKWNEVFGNAAPPIDVAKSFQENLQNVEATNPQVLVDAFNSGKLSDLKQQFEGNQAPAAAPAETKAPAFKEGDRVTWTDRNGKQLSGAIRGRIYSDGIARVDTDQIAHAGGVPIGRIESVHVSNLQHEGTPATAAKTEPTTLYHGSNTNQLSNLQGGTWFTESKDLANSFAKYRSKNDTHVPAVYQSHVDLNKMNLVDISNVGMDQYVTRPEAAQLFHVTEQELSNAYDSGTIWKGNDQSPVALRHLVDIPAITDLLKSKGYDGIKAKEQASRKTGYQPTYKIFGETAGNLISDTKEVTANVARSNQATNATEPAGNVPAASTVGAVGSNAAANPETNPGPVGSNEGATSAAEPGSGEGQPARANPTPESNSQPGAGVGSEQRTVSEQENRTEPGAEPATVPGQQPSGSRERQPSVSRRDFVITNELDNLGGAKTKYKNNVTAIRTLQQIESEDRYATPEEQSVLAKYVGWGGVQDAFDERKVDSKEWGKEIAEMKQLVTDGVISQAEYEAARKSTMNAHYTSPQVIDAIYKALDRMGFAGGRVLEPSMGTGNFFGLMPGGMTAGSERTGVELDPITGRIARQLYQKADVQIKGFEKFKVGDNTFDVAVGNVPFGSYGVTDPTYKGKMDFVTSRIHNYFFIKSLDKVRPGGVVAFVTSSGTMNAGDGAKIREFIGQKADFLGAIRLPSDAFKQSAGTEVTTDILFLQKRPEGQQAKHVDSFTNVVPSDLLSKVDNKPMSNNEYFVKHPEMVLGAYYEDKLYPGRLGVVSDGRDMGQALQDAVNRLPANIYEDRGTPVQETQDQAVSDYAVGNLDEGAYAVKNGLIVQRVGDKMVPAKVTGETANRIKDLVGVRDAARTVLTDQLNGASDAELKKSQDQLNKLYDAFTKKFGILNHPSNLKAFQDDPIGQSVIRALENNVKAVKDGKKTNYTAAKADIFSERTIQAVSNVESVDNSDEALVVSLFEKGKIDFAHMTKLTGKDQAALISELEGKIFENPNGGWQPADEYLSGNVRQKLRDAQATAERDPKFQGNADALKAVQPQDLTPTEINVKLGATWLDPQDITDFIHGFLDVQNRVKVRYQPILGQWSVDELRGTYQNSLQNNAKNTDEYGVKPKYGRYLTATDLIEDALNLKQPTVTYKTDDDKTHTDVEATNEARAKLKQIQDVFKDWLWQDEERAARLATKYNELFNSTRLREFNGEQVYNKPIPGMSAKWNKLYAHQKDAIWRMVQGDNTLLAHEVGFGKTASVIAASQEMKRLGLANKPMIAVPNFLMNQWENTFREMYPNAKILKIDAEGIPGVRPPRVQIKDEATGGKRKLTDAEYAQRLNQNRANRAAALGKIAFGNYDAILISHETFGKLPMSPEAVQEHIREQLDDLTQAIQAAAADEGKRSDTVKQLESAKTKLQQKIETNLDEQSKDVAIPFEQLGVDQIFVDEAHFFKNLKFHTKMTRVSGLPQTASKRAQDMYLKSQWLTKQRGGRGVVFATGTPISNTMAEMFTLQRYLSMPQLRETGISHFDSWASTFGDTKTDFEMDATGKYKQKTRFARFQNVPELMTMFRDFADIKTADMIKLPRPDHIERHLITSSMTDSQQTYLADMVDRANAIKSGAVKPEEDNYLKLTTDGRKMSVDVRLVDPKAENDPDSKINKAINNIYGVWNNPDLAKDKAGDPIENPTQLVFLDLGTPKAKKQSDDEESTTNGDNEAEDQQSIGLYDEIRSQLVKKGIPKEQIAFIHEAKTDKAKEQLFLNVNAGNVRVLVGSTGKMGAGMNVQTKLVALHHIDAPWKPAEVEQREGRIIRPGNDNNRVHIFTYVTEGSFDAIMWNTLKIKAKFVNQLMNGTANVRTMEDVEELTLGYSHIAAVASGNPLILEKHEIDQKVLELQSLKTGYERNKSKQQSEIAKLPGAIAGSETKLKGYEKDLKTRQDTKGDNFSLAIGKETFTDRKEAGQKVIDAYNEKYDRLSYGENEKIGSFAGFDLYVGKPQQLFLQGEGGRYSAEVNSESPVGTVTRLDNAVSHIESRIDETESAIKNGTKRLDDLKKLAARPFEQEQELKDAVTKQSDIIGQLSEMDGDNNAVAGTPDESSNNDDVLAYIAPRSAGSGGGTTGESKPVDPANSPQVIMQDTLKHLTPNAAKTVSDTVAKALGTVIRKGHVKSVAEGQYSLKSKTGAVRGRSMYDWRVVGHELGHAFQDLHEFDGVKPELESVANALYPAPGKIPAGKKALEGFAEFFRVWTVDPEHAAKIAPQTTKAFESFVGSDPQLTELFDTIRTIVDNDLAGTPLGRAMGMMAGGKRISSDNIGDEYRVEWWKRPAFNIADFTIPARDLTKAAEEQGYSGADLSKIMAIVGSGRAQAEVSFRGRPRDKAGQFVTNGRSLQEIAQSAINHIDKAINYTKTKIPGSSKQQGAAEIFNAIMFANRFAERYDRGFEKLPMTQEDAKWIVQYSKDNYPEAYNDAVEYARTLSNMQLDLLVGEDMLTPDERDRVLAGSDYYIPTIYQQSKGFFSSGKSEGGKTNKNPVHRFREGTAPVLNFADASLLSLATVHQAIEMKRVVSTMRELLQTEGVGRFGRIIPNPTKMIQVSAQDMMERINDVLQNPVDVKDVPNQLFNIFLPGGFEMLKNQPVIMDKHNGQMVFMELAPDLARSVMSMQQLPAEGIMRLMGYVSKVERTVGLLNPSYLLGAISRDFTQGIVQSKAPVASFVREWGKALLVVAGSKMGVKQAREIMDAYIQSGAHAGVADRVLKDTLGTAFKTGLFQTKATGWMKPIKGTQLGFVRVVRTLPEAMRVIEEQPHLAEWMATWKMQVAKLAKETGENWNPNEMFNKYVKEGVDGLPPALQDAMEDVLLQSAYASRENPLNIAMHGTSGFTRKLTGSVPFMTGGVQGIYRTIRMMGDPKQRGTAMLRMALLLIPLTLLSWVSMNNKMKDKYNDLPSDIRDKYWLFPGLDGNYIAIRKPIEPSLALNMFERFLDWTYHNTPESRNLFTDWFDAVRSSVDVHMNIAGLSTIINLWANKDSFGSPIVPQSQQTLAKEMQFGPSSSQFGIKMAQLYSQLTADPNKGPSPRQTDFFIKQTFGTFGNIGLQMFDMAMGKPTAGGALGALTSPVVGALVKDATSGGSKITDTFYNDYGNAQTLSQSTSKLIQANTGSKPGFVTPQNALQLHYLPALTAIDKELAGLRKTYTAAIEQATTPEQKKTMQAQQDYFIRLGAGLLFGVSPGAPTQAANLNDQQVQAMSDFIAKKAQDAMNAAATKNTGPNAEANYMMMLLKDPAQASGYAAQINNKNKPAAAQQQPAQKTTP